MRKNRINITVVLLASAIISLFLIQGYQTSQIYDRNYTQFKLNRSSSLERIAIRHEKTEDIRKYMTLMKNDFREEYKKTLKSEFKSLIKSSEISLKDTSIFNSQNKETKHFILEGISKDSLENDLKVKLIIPEITKVRQLFKKNENKDLSQDSLSIEDKLDQLILQKLFTKAKFVNDAMYRAFNQSKALEYEKRINLLFIDSLIKSEISNDNLPKKYQFMIVNEKGKPIKFKNKAKNYNSKLFKADCGKTLLFPNNLLDEKLYLHLSFPDENLFVFEGMKTSLYITFLLVILVGIALFSMYKTILLQRNFSELRNDFISNMTHEFKTPISTIKLACEALSDDDVVEKNDKETLAPYLNMIHLENKRLSNLVDSILKSAVMLKGEMKYENQEICMNELVKEISEKFKFRIKSLNGKLKLNITDTPVYSICDKLHVSNAISNLIDNAIKYSADNLEVEISLFHIKKQAILAITDKGIGIKEEYLNKIFDNLFRVPTGNVHNVKGFGLGLNYAKGVFDYYGWKISVNSTFQKGTSFRILIKNKNDDELRN